MRVGIGYDSHRLVENRRLILGGTEIAWHKGLLGHSDGDVLLHAIGDAVCGAAGLPDIGRLFPDSDAAWKDADSWILLQSIAGRARDDGWQIENVDAVLVAQAPKIAPYIDAMKTRIAAALECEIERVNVRGKTAENLGPIGAGEGMEAHAVCLLRKEN